MIKVISGKYLDSLSNITILHFLSLFPNGDNRWQFNHQDITNCLNEYFASISTVYGELPSYLLCQSLHITPADVNCAEHKIETMIARVIKCQRVSPNLFFKTPMYFDE